jgi:glucose-1-phosphate adenylyltransferase
MITEGCVVNGEVVSSVLSNSVTIEEGAFVKDCVIMGGVTVKKGARVEYSIIDHDCVIEEGAVVGASREAGNKIAVLGAGYVVAKGEKIEPGAMCEAQK